MKWLTLVSALVISTNVFALAGGCRGEYQGQEVLLNAYGEGNDPREASGTVSVDGREVARFDGRDARINYLFQTAKVTNAQGDLAEGRVVSLLDKTGIITRLQVQGYGIDFRNVPVQCWVD